MIQQRVLDRINRDNLSADFCYETTETSLCADLGKAIFTAYSRHLSILTVQHDKNTTENDFYTVKT